MAMDMMAAVMSRETWNADTCDEVARLLRRTGRAVEEVADGD